MSTTIPPITDPMGRYWDQPPRDEMLVDDTHAVMNVKTYKMLAEYSLSMPSGVYDGKMWRRCEPEGDFLMWYGPSEKPGSCSINGRLILLV